MSYNIFLEISVFYWQIIIQNALYLPHYIYKYKQKFNLKQHFNEFFLFPSNVRPFFRDVLTFASIKKTISSAILVI